MPVTHQGTTAAVIESGRVLDVDISNYTLAVTTQYSKKPQTGITWSSPYLHFVNGEGVFIMPEVGSLCWICFPSDGNRPFVLGWAPTGDEGDYRSRRLDLNPGDIYLGTRDENFLVLRRGGVVQIGGGPLSQRIFLPVNNTIKDFCENYGLHTLGGDLEWSIQRDVNTTDGKRPALLSIKAREMAQDEKPIAELLVGSHGPNDKTILSLVIKESGANGAARKISLKLGKDGNVTWEVNKDVVWKADGKYSIEAAQDVSFKSTGGKVAIEASNNVEVTGGSGVIIKANSGSVDITGNQVTINSKCLVGSSPIPVLLAPPLMAWLASHTHAVSGPMSGPASAGAAGPPPTAAVSQTLLAT
jgi:hypothetical protein